MHDNNSTPTVLLLPPHTTHIFLNVAPNCVISVSHKWLFLRPNAGVAHSPYGTSSKIVRRSVCMGCCATGILQDRSNGARAGAARRHGARRWCSAYMLLPAPAFEQVFPGSLHRADASLGFLLSPKAGGGAARAREADAFGGHTLLWRQGFAACLGRETQSGSSQPRCDDLRRGLERRDG